MSRAHAPRKSGIRLSIRLKVLSVLTGVVLLALGTYVYLATSLFTRDKLAYVFDLNAALVETLSEQTRSSLEVLVQALTLFGPSMQPSKHIAANEDLLFRAEPHLLRVELYAFSPDAGTASLLRSIENPTAMQDLGLAAQDLVLLRQSDPLPFAAIHRAPRDMYLQNSSLPPDAGILTLAAISPADPNLVVVADFRHERLLRFFGKSSLHETYLVDARGHVLAHPEAEAVLSKRNLASSPLVREALESAVTTGVRTFRQNDGIVMLGAYGKVGLGRLVVLSQIPQSEALRASRELIARSLWFALVVLLAAAIASVVLSRVLTAPIRRLRAATEAVGKGHFNVNVDVRARDEIGDLAISFRQMGSALKETQAQLVHSEKLAAFGQLGAGITHEVKNPMTAIIGFAQLAQRRTEDPQKVQELLEIIEKEGKRCQEILVNFLKFAQASSRQVATLNINDEVQGACKLFAHQLNMNGIKLKVTLAEQLPAIRGNSSELQQVLLNLVMNAQQAMQEGGEVRVATSMDVAAVLIEVRDNGPGIPAAIQDKIFEPFFTTKPPGEGTGLGLSICFRIIHDHGGTITVESDGRHGTRFVIRLPADDDEQAAA